MLKLPYNKVYKKIAIPLLVKNYLKYLTHKKHCVMNALKNFLEKIKNRKSLIIVPLMMLTIIGPQVFASSNGGGHESAAATTFLWIAILLIAAKFSSIIEKWGQPAVLGELIIGVILGNLTLIGLGIFTPIGDNTIIHFLAELGVVILLFQIGLESNIHEMKKVGISAFLVAIIGVVLPFIFGTYIVGPWLLPGLETNSYLFLGATLTATSVGITARVFKDLGKLKIKEAQIVLGAAVIDDILGLVILAVVSAIVTAGTVSVGSVAWIIGKSVLFLIIAIALGQLLAPHISKGLSKIHRGIGMKFTLAICFALIFSYLANKIGLAPIIGAFAAGLVLDPVQFVYFKNPEIVDEIKEVIEHENETIKKKLLNVVGHHSHKHIEDIIEPLSLFLVPIFFVITGFQVNLSTLGNTSVLLTAFALTIAAIIGKVLAGLFAGKGVNRWLVGWGMVPRGEVGLIFASIGKALHVVSDEVFSVIVIMVIITTLMTPPILNILLKRQKTSS